MNLKPLIFAKSKTLGVWLAALGFYFILALLGLYLASLNQSASPVWPAAGFAIACVSLKGWRFASTIFLGSFAANYLNSSHFLVSLGIASGNALSGVLAAYVLNWIRVRIDLGTYRFPIAFSLASVTGASISALFGCISLVSLGGVPSSAIGAIAATWWIGDFLGGVFVTPLLVGWYRSRKMSSAYIFEGFGLAVIAAFCSYLLFAQESGARFIFICFPLLLFIYLRRGTLALYAGALGVQIGGVVATYYGDGIFQSGNLNADFVHMQIFLSSIALSALFFPSLISKNANRKIFFVLAMTWVAAGSIFFLLYTKNRQQMIYNFNEIVKIASERLENQEIHYQATLKAGVGLFHASSFVSREEWANFAGELKEANEATGIKGVGVIFKVNKTELNDFLRILNIGRRDVIRYRRLVSKEDNHQDALVISMIEPEEGNQAALGLDIGTEINRRLAAERATENFQATLSGPIRLVQDTGKGYGFLVLYPLRDKFALSSQEPLKKFSGWVYAPIIAERYFSQALGDRIRDQMSYSIRHEESGTEVVHSEDYYLYAHRNVSLDQVVALEFGGQKFLMSVKPSPNFNTDLESTCSWAGALTILGGLLLVGIISRLQSTKDQIEELVQQRTEELELTGQVARVGGWELHLHEERLVLSPVAMQVLGEGKNLTRNHLRSFLLKLWPLDQIEWAEQLVKSKNLKDWDITVAMPSHQGEEKWIRVIGRIPRDDTRLGTLYGTVQDISEEKKRERMLHQASKMASLGEMASGIAHEINNPLMIISGKMLKVERLLGEANLKNESADEIQVIKATVKRIANIIKGLRDFSRNGEVDDFSEFALEDMIKDTVTLCEERFRNGGVGLKIMAVPPVKILAKPSQLDQVFLNLLNNAYDAVSGSNSPWVSIDFEVKGHLIEIRITDSGSGIPLEIADKIMQPFFTTKEIGKGTGIGLSIAKGIASSHGGDLVLDRTCPNTCFVVTLPLAHEVLKKAF